MENINTLTEATIFQPKFDNTFYLKYNEAKTAVTDITDAVTKLGTAYNKFIQDMNEMNKFIYDSTWSGNEKNILTTVNNTINLFNLTAQSISTHVQETNDSLKKTSQEAGETVKDNKTSIDSSLEDIQKANNGDNGGGTSGGGNNQPSTPSNPSTPSGPGIPQFDENGYIVRTQSQAAQDVINKLYSDIDSTKPAGVTVRAQGTHSPELDAMIDNLSPEECAWVMSRIENDVYGQSDRSGSRTPESDAHFIENQVIRRYGGDIHNLLKSWGTYSYGGY